MAFGLVAILSFEVVDLFFVSQLGDAPLAAISFTFPVIWLIDSMAIGYESGAASCVSRAIGSGGGRIVNRLTTDSALLAGATGLLVTAIGLFTIRPVFTMLGATEDLLPLIDDYMSVWYFVAPSSAILWTVLASVRARGNAMIEGKVIAAAAAINVVLDPIFIFGWFGFPRMEMAGAAIATLTADLIVLIFTLVYFSGWLKVFANPFAKPAEIAHSWRLLLPIGLPAMLTNAIVPISSAIVVAMVATYGVDAVAGFGIAMRIEPIALIPFYALSAAASPFAGQNFGALAFDRLHEARRVMARFSAVFGTLLGLALCLVAHPLAMIFTDSPVIQGVAVQYIWLVAFSYGAYGFEMSVNAAFNGMGYPMPAVWLSALRGIVIFLPLAFFGRWLFDLPGLFLASTVSNAVVAVVAFYWLRRHIDRVGSGRDSRVSR